MTTDRKVFNKVTRTYDSVITHESNSEIPFAVNKFLQGSTTVRYTGLDTPQTLTKTVQFYHIANIASGTKTADSAGQTYAYVVPFDGIITISGSIKLGHSGDTAFFAVYAVGGGGTTIGSYNNCRIILYGRHTGNTSYQTYSGDCYVTKGTCILFSGIASGNNANGEWKDLIIKYDLETDDTQITEDLQY